MTEREDHGEGIVPRPEMATSAAVSSPEIEAAALEGDDGWRLYLLLAIREAIEDVVMRAIEAGWTPQMIREEVAYAIDNCEEL